MTETNRSITDTSFELPSLEQLLRVLTLADYNTRVVVIGVMLLGLASGLIGSFLLLRKRALLGDALSHATLPGIGLAFIVMSALGGSGKSLPGLLAGAALFGALGVACILLITRYTRLKQDAALGVVLSVFFGLGVAVLGVVQKLPVGSAAGLESFIYGKTASMVFQDAVAIGGAALLLTLVCLLLFKEFTVLCFDDAYAAAQGWPTVWLDTLMMGLVVAVTVIGLQAVGLILMIAMLIIPPAAARFWTRRLPRMIAVAAALGAVSGLLGAGLSALVPRLPAGAVVVLVAGAAFLVSMICGAERGVIVRWLSQWRLSRRVLRQHLLRAIFECAYERQHGGRRAPTPGASRRQAVPFADLLGERSWSPLRLRAAIRSAARDGLVQAAGAPRRLRLTAAGEREAQRVVRNHRLWELYLIQHADIAPSHVDRDADDVEHVLGPTLTAQLEALLAAQHAGPAAPPSPHALGRT